MRTSICIVVGFQQSYFPDKLNAIWFEIEKKVFNNHLDRIVVQDISDPEHFNGQFVIYTFCQFFFFLQKWKIPKDKLLIPRLNSEKPEFQFPDTRFAIWLGKR